VTDVLCSDISSNLVKILVGPAEIFFTAHKAVLKRIPYFQKGLGGQFQEATTKTIKLPDDQPELFEQIMEYAYRGQCTFSRTMPVDRDRTEQQLDEARDTLMLLLQLYALADRLCIEELANHLVDLYIESCTHFAVLGEAMAYLTDRGPPNGKLRDFALEQTAWRICSDGWDSYKAATSCMFEDFMDISVANCQAVLEKTFNTQCTTRRINPRKKNKYL
jgi:hypothetical protein